MEKRMSLQICLRFLIIFGIVLGGCLALFHFGFYSFRLHSIGRSIESAYFYFHTLNLSALVDEVDDDHELDEEAYGANLNYILLNEDFVPVISNEKIDQIQFTEEELWRAKNAFTEKAKAVYENGTFGEQMVLRGELISGMVKYYIVIYRRTSLIHKYIQFTEKILVQVLLVLWAVAALILLLVIRSSTRPLGAFTEEISAILNGNYIRRIDVDLLSKEYVESADRINKLAEYIYSLQNELDNYRYLVANRKILDTLEIEKRRDAVAEATHQLKTPLAIISSQLELAYDESDREKKEYYFQSIMEEIDKLSYLISEILSNASRHGNMSSSFYPRNFSISELIAELVPKYESWLSSQKIIFISHIAPDVYIEADPMQVEIVVHNFMTNACKHTKARKTISLRLIEEEDRCTIRVHNDGEGIPESIMDQVWKRYYQGIGEGGRSEVGLGLYIVRDIMLRHGGEYGVVNDTNGVEFYVSFLKRLQER